MAGGLMYVCKRVWRYSVFDCLSNWGLFCFGGCVGGRDSGLNWGAVVE